MLGFSGGKAGRYGRAAFDKGHGARVRLHNGWVFSFCIAKGVGNDRLSVHQFSSYGALSTLDLMPRTGYYGCLTVSLKVGPVICQITQLAFAVQSFSLTQNLYRTG